MRQAGLVRPCLPLLDETANTCHAVIMTLPVGIFESSIEAPHKHNKIISR